MNGFVGALIAVFIYPYLLMLTLGGIRSEVSDAVPAPTFAGSLVLTALIFLVATVFGAASKSTD